MEAQQKEEGCCAGAAVLFWTLACVGLIVVGRRIARVCEAAVRWWLLSSSSNSSKQALGQYSAGWGRSWAVVTGAAGGIGREFARAAAAAGLNVLLIDRDAGAVAKVAAEVAAESAASASGSASAAGVETRAVAADLSVDGGAGCFGGEVAAAVEGLGDVAVLVNNAGLTVDPPGLLHEVDAGQVARIVAVNVGAVTALTHLVVRKMLSRNSSGGGDGDGSSTEKKKKKKSARKSLVITMGSFAARAPLPMLQVYSASKRYVEHLSAALGAEYAGRIDFVCGAPWWVATPMTRIRRANWRVVGAGRFVRGLLAYVGGRRACAGTCGDPVDPYPLHALCDALVEALPSALVSAGVTSFMRRVRASFFRRQKRIQEEQAAAGTSTAAGGEEEKKSK